MNGTPAAAAAWAVAISSVRVGEPVDGHRRDRQRQRARRTQERRRRIDGRDVDQHAGSQAPAPPGRFVFGEGDLVPGATRDIIERGGIDHGARQRLEVGEADDPRKDIETDVLAAAADHPTRSRLARLASIVLRPTEASLKATVTSSSLRVSLLVTTMPSPQRA